MFPCLSFPISARRLPAALPAGPTPRQRSPWSPPLPRTLLIGASERSPPSQLRVQLDEGTRRTRGVKSEAPLPAGPALRGGAGGRGAAASPSHRTGTGGTPRQHPPPPCPWVPGRRARLEPPILKAIACDQVGLRPRSAMPPMTRGARDVPGVGGGVAAMGRQPGVCAGCPAMWSMIWAKLSLSVAVSFSWARGGGKKI